MALSEIKTSRFLFMWTKVTFQSFVDLKTIIIIYSILNVHILHYILDLKWLIYIKWKFIEKSHMLP